MKKAIYCVYCGEKNKESDLECKKCKKKLNPKNHLFKDFLIDHIKDDLQCNVEDTIFSLIKKWIISHLYGLGVFAAIVFTGTILLQNEFQFYRESASVKKISSPFLLQDICSTLEVLKVEEKCEEGYSLENHKCVKIRTVDAIQYFTCHDNFTFMGGNCISNYTIDYTQHMNCPWTLVGTRVEGRDPSKIMRAYEDGGGCKIDFCEDTGSIPGYTPGGTCPGRVFTYDTTPEYSTTCDGYELDGTCRVYGEVFSHFTCNEGELKDQSCEIREEKDSFHACPEGTLYHDKCHGCLKEDA